jgi:hypothetical protein
MKLEIKKGCRIALEKAAFIREFINYFDAVKEQDEVTPS